MASRPIETIPEFVRRTRAESGLPELIEDVGTAERIASCSAAMAGPTDDG